MTIRQILLFIGTALCQQSAAQTPAIDSLQQRAAAEPNIGKKAFLLYETVDLQSLLDTALAYKTLREVRILAQGNRYLQAFDPFYEAQIIWMGDSAKTKRLYQKSISQLQSYSTFKAFQVTARAWHNYGIFLQIVNQQDKFVDILLSKVIPLSTKIGDTLSAAAAYNAVASVYGNKGNHEAALKYYKRTIEAAGYSMQAAPKKSMVLAEAYTLGAGSMIYLQDNPDSIYHSLELAQQYLSHVKDPIYHADYYRYLGMYYKMQGDRSSALTQYNMGMKYAEKSPTMTIGIINLAYEKAEALMQLKRYREAKVLLDNRLALKSNDFSIRNRASFLKLRSEAEAQLGVYPSAYQSLKAWSILSDSLHAKAEKEKIAEITLKYNNAEQENKILKLETASRRNLFLAICTVLFLLLAALIFFIVLRHRKRRGLQQLKLLFAEKEVAVKNALIYGEEEERKRLARELHDGLGGTFSGIKLKLENAVRKHDFAEIHSTVGLLDSAIREFRQTTHRLVPDHLKNNGLENNIKDFCLSFRTSGVRFQFYFKGLEALRDNEKELVIFRIIQELITNAIKHSKAGNILLNCIVEDQLLLLTVEDNGIGFDPFLEKEGLGLNNIRSRISMLNGDIHIDSGMNKGTVINIEIVL